MKLYVYLPSYNSIKVMAVVHHLGLDPELENINPTKGETQTPEFIAINPNGKIPTLQDGDFTLWESQAIMRYLAEKHESDLVPSELSQKALMDQWLCWNIAHFTPAVGGVVWERLAPQIIEGYQPDERQLAKSLENLARFAPILDKHLEDREFVVGSRLTIADFALAAPLPYAEAAQLPISHLSNLNAWFQRVLKVPGFRKALPPAPVSA